MQPDSSGRFNNSSSDFEQPQADCSCLRSGKFSVLCRDMNDTHQDCRRNMQKQTELVREEAMAACSAGEHIEFELFDPILDVTSGAVLNLRARHETEIYAL